MARACVRALQSILKTFCCGLVRESGYAIPVSHPTKVNRYRTLEKATRWIFAVFLFVLILTSFNRELLFFGLDARILPAALASCAIVCAILNAFTAGRSDYRLRMRGSNRWLVIYFILAILCNVAWLNSPHVMVESIFRTVLTANALNLVFVIAIGLNKKHLNWKLLAPIILVSGGVLFASMFAAFAGVDLRDFSSAYPGGASDGISRTVFNEYRFAGYAQDPNFASLFMVIWGAVAVHDWRRTGKLAYLLVAPLAVFGYLISFSKSILVMIVVAVIIVLMGRSVLGALAKELLLLGAFVGPLVVGALGTDRLGIETLSLRFAMWSNALELVPDHLAFGNGLTAARSANLPLDWYVQNHSTVTQTTVELGIVGLAVLYLAVRRAMMCAHPVNTFVQVAFLGTFLTYETMSHTLCVLVLGILPVALRQGGARSDKEVSIYVVNGLNHGGAERVVQNMIGATPQEKAVRVYSFGETEGTLPPVFTKAEVASLGRKRSYALIPIYVWRLNVYLERDWSRCNVLLATSHLPYSQLICRLSRFDDNFLYVLHGMYGVAHRGFGAWLTRWMYNGRKLISVSHQFLEEEMVGNFRVRTRQSAVIYNPLDTESIDEQVSPYLDEPELKQIVSLGRYENPKNQEAAIAAFDRSGLAKDGYTLELFGEGSRRDVLQQEVDSRGMQGSVSLRGFTENPYRELRRSALLVHTAEYESFTMVIVEAHCCGTPVVAFDVPFGAREVMPGKLREYLVPFDDTEALAHKMRQAIYRPYPREEGERVVGLVSPDLIMSRYFDTYRSWCLEESHRR